MAISQSTALVCANPARLNGKSSWLAELLSGAWRTAAGLHFDLTPVNPSAVPRTTRSAQRIVVQLNATIEPRVCGPISLKNTAAGCRPLASLAARLWGAERDQRMERTKRAQGEAGQAGVRGVSGGFGGPETMGSIVAFACGDFCRIGLSILRCAMIDSISDWDNDPVKAFAAFIDSPSFSVTSRRFGGRPEVVFLASGTAKVYVFMFNKFARWLAGQGKLFSQVTHVDLQAFLGLSTFTEGELDIKSSIAHRYLRLLERCYGHLEVQPNPVRHTVFGRIDSGIVVKDKETVSLSEQELANFLAALPEHTLTSTRGKEINRWKRRRDRAMQLMMLGAGLKVSEAIGFQVDELSPDPQPDGTYIVTVTPEAKNRTSVEHLTYLHQLAAPEVLQWREERLGLNIPGQLMFPANVDGDPLSRVTVYRQVKATLDRAKIVVDRKGGRILRNTFAVKELDGGASEEELAERLGLAQEGSVDTYTRASAKRK